eukprot:2942797-Rhodomonas_salina.1
MPLLPQAGAGSVVITVGYSLSSRSYLQVDPEVRCSPTRSRRRHSAAASIPTERVPTGVLVLDSAKIGI